MKLIYIHLTALTNLIKYVLPSAKWTAEAEPIDERLCD